MATLKTINAVNESFKGYKATQTVLSLVLGKDSVEVLPLATPVSAFLEEFSDEVMDTRISLGAVDFVAKNLNHQVINIVAKDESRLSDAKQGFFIDFDSTPIGVYQVAGMGKESYLYDVRTNKQISFKKSIGLKFFKPTLYNNSQVKKHASYAVGYDLTDKHALGKLEKRFDRLTGGAYSAFKTGKLSYDKYVKALSRIAQTATPSIDLAKIVGRSPIVAVLMDEDARIAADGGGIATAGYLADVANSAAGEKLYTDNDLAGVLMQCRPEFSMAKMAVQTEERAYVIRMMEHYEVVYIAPEEYGKYEEHVRKCFTDLESSPLYKKLVVFGPKGSVPDVINDLNSQKAYVDFSLPSDFRFMAMGSVKKNTANLSMQMQQSFVLDPTAIKLGSIDYLKNKLAETIDNKFKRELNPEKVHAEDGGFNVEYHSAVAEPNMVFGDKIFARGILAKSAANYAYKKDKAIIMSNTNSMMESVSFTLTKGRIELPGVYAHGTVDRGFDLGYNILGEFECYSPDANAYFKNKQGFYISTFRSPKPGSNDQDLLRALTLDEIKERVNQLVANEKDRELIIRSYSNVSRGVLVAPISADFSLIHSGSDWDFDGFTLIFDQGYVQIAKNLNKVLRDPKPRVEEGSSTVNVDDGVGDLI